MRKAYPVICLLLLSLGVAPSASPITFIEAAGPDLPGAETSPGASPKLVAAPYVQNTSVNAATIMWQTDVPTRGELTVGGGESGARYTTRRPRRLTEVRIGDLSPGITYTYQLSIADDQGQVEQETLRRVGTFSTFPVEARPLRFIVYGDSRSRPKRHARVTSAMALERDVDFVLHTGDIVEAGAPHEWIPQFFEPAAPVTRSVPFFTVLGNHENNSPFYFQYFSLPMDERWYSFDVLDVHVVMLDSNVSFDEDSEQYDWLVADLAAHKDAKWRFVVMHHPVHTSGWHGALADDGLPRETPIRVAQKLFPGLARRYRIAAFFSGHDHHYEHGVVDGVHYVITGAGGAPGNKDRNAEKKPNSRGGFSCAVLHYCLVTVDGEIARILAKTADGEVLDTIDLLVGASDSPSQADQATDPRAVLSRIVQP